MARVTTLPLETYWSGQYKQACNILLWLYFYFAMQGKVSVSLLATHHLSSPKFLLLEKGLWSLSLKSSFQFQILKNMVSSAGLLVILQSLGHSLSLPATYVAVSVCMKPKLAKRGNWWNYSQYGKLTYACTMCKLHCFLPSPCCLQNSVTYLLFFNLHIQESFVEV